MDWEVKNLSEEKLKVQLKDITKSEGRGKKTFGSRSFSCSGRKTTFVLFIRTGSETKRKCPVNKSSRTQTLLVILQDTASFIVSRRSDGAS